MKTKLVLWVFITIAFVVTLLGPGNISWVQFGYEGQVSADELTIKEGIERIKVFDQALKAGDPQKIQEAARLLRANRYAVELIKNRPHLNRKLITVTSDTPSEPVLKGSSIIMKSSSSSTSSTKTPIEAHKSDLPGDKRIHNIPKSQRNSPIREATSLSPDQRDMVNELGYPDSFLLMITTSDSEQHPKATRNEIWNYYGLNMSFVMKDGVLHNSEEIEDLPGEMLLPVMYRPDQFGDKMHWMGILDEVIKDKPFDVAPLPDEILAGVDIVGAEQIIMGFERELLVYVETFPISLTLEEPTTDRKNEESQ